MVVEGLVVDGEEVEVIVLCVILLLNSEEIMDSFVNVLSNVYVFILRKFLCFYC